MLKLPQKIADITGNKSYTADTTGKSDGSVYIYDDYVLKTEKNTKNADTCVKITEWLGDRLPVPRIIAHEVSGDMSYLLMSRIKGNMACDKYFLERPDELIPILADAFRMMWSIDISDCPVLRDADTELSEARYRVEHNMVNMDNWEPETKRDFKDPTELLDWLERNKPSFEPVFSHGDFCLPNIFIENSTISGFIDIGDSGTGDKWRDLSYCWRSIKHNCDGTFCSEIYDIDPDMLFEELGISPDREKLSYYILLDELF
ncbi:MAG: aminoglycoside 3'-phosphotransferase [Oscillospiraceae bacterium]|nr:aminoglycoside 3'-phosphotransferase [Oscillospiraceae bacterium]